MSIPHDPASVFVYVLLVVSGYLIWKASRGKKAGGPDRTREQ